MSFHQVSRAFAALLAAAVSWGGAATALADVDPPSDVLVFQNVYFPYQPKVCTEVRKGLEKMNDFKRQGKTIVVAGHDMALFERWCDQAILLDKGRVTADGAPSDVVAAYRASMEPNRAYVG